MDSKLEIAKSEPIWNTNNRVISIIAGLVILLFALPLFGMNSFYLHLFIMIFMHAVMAQSWNVIAGFSGQISLGHGAFFGIGCVGVAGGMMANYFFIFTDVGINFALFAFVAVALGGFGSIIGCLYAGIIIGLVESLGGLLIDPSFKLLYVFAIYLLVVIYKPQGLFGRY